MKQNSNISGKVLIFSAPSGAGKSTVVNHLMNKFNWMGFSVSATSRLPRGAEKDGKEYFFFTEQEFSNKIKEEAFVEYEEVYPGRYYGTLKSEVERIWSLGKVVVFDIDVKGGVNLKKLYKSKALSIFIMPPSMETLRERLTKRGTETHEAIEIRLARAQQEIGYSKQFDIVLVNDKLEDCLEAAEQIVNEFYKK
ncbi:MAG: guanylate kinase [Bacteroidia bacterium]|jgi:guanylate kinase|nr:guanylate kinase [Bacteroidia bacterium]